MSRPSRAAVELIDDAREHTASCLDMPRPSESALAGARREVERATRSVGCGMRPAMASVESELAARRG